eukprot:INCI508.2.p1 GENE.INCI508.2~~INCI508.2.p1  ORF type:complete len:248 (-),score=57.56 INCI508.2:302-1045(-)
MRAISDVRRQASKNIARKKPATKKKRKTLFERYGAPEEDESLKSLKLMQRIKEQSELHNLSERVRSNKKQKKKEQGGGVDWANTKHSHIDSAQGPIAQLALRRLQHREAMKAKAAALKLAKLQGLRQAYEEVKRRVDKKNAAFEELRTKMQGKVAKLAKAGDFAGSASVTKDLRHRMSVHNLDLKPLQKQMQVAQQALDREELRLKADDKDRERRRAAGEILPEEAADAAFIPWPPWGDNNKFVPFT